MTDSEFKDALLAIEQKEMALAEERKALRLGGIQTVQNIVDRLGLTAAEIRWPSPDAAVPAPIIAAAKKPRGNVAPKYRGPEGQLWTGRGRKPLWAQAIVNAGEDLDAYLIK